MKSANDWDEAYLLELIRVGEQESLTLDYKSSPGLAKTDKCRSDLSKDVSAFANSAGGLLVYGMLENGHLPTAIDGGVDRNVITKEWLESVIKSVIQPVVDDLVIKQMDLPSKGADKVAYVVQIAQASSRAPHQANDYRYYKRFNFESTPMEDYEVRDLMRRSIEYGKKYGTAWNLFVELRRLDSAMRERVQLDGGAYLPRNRLAISISNDLRASGEAIMSLDRDMRKGVANLVNEVDQFNSIIETTDPGQRDVARMTEPLKQQLRGIIMIAQEAYRSLSTFLDSAP
jgi:hypothetical protein